MYKGDAMKMLVFSIIVGFVLLYFLNIAVFKAPVLNLLWSIHAVIRFLAGFFNTWRQLFLCESAYI